MDAPATNPTDREILDAVDAGQTAWLEESDLRARFDCAVHVGFTISEDALRRIRLDDDDIFAFLKPGFQETWGRGISWDDLSDKQKGVVLEAVWADQAHEIWLSGLFVAVVADGKGRFALLLFRHDGDPWVAETCGFLEAFADFAQLAQFVERIKFAHLDPTAGEWVVNRLANIRANATHQSEVAMRLDPLTPVVRDNIRKCSGKANWREVAGPFSNVWSSAAWSQTINSFVTDYFLRTGEFPTGAHKISDRGKTLTVTFAETRQ